MCVWGGGGYSDIFTHRGDRGKLYMGHIETARFDDAIYDVSYSN